VYRGALLAMRSHLCNLQLPVTTAGSGPPGQTCVIHHRTDELLVEQHTVCDCSFYQGWEPRTPNISAAFFPTWLKFTVQVSCVSRVTPRCFVPLYWLFYKLHLSRFLNACRGLNEESSCYFRNVRGHSPTPLPERP
jgi:hypothetical protein